MQRNPDTAFTQRQDAVSLEQALAFAHMVHQYDQMVRYPTTHPDYDLTSQRLVGMILTFATMTRQSEHTVLDEIVAVYNIGKEFS